MNDIVVIGAGVFGTTAAIELGRRGFQTALVDPGPIPHPLAGSTDISKVIRMEYGVDEQYMEMVEACMPRWREWNNEFGETLYYETGVAMLSRTPMEPGGFEFESYHTLLRRGHKPERLDADEISRRFPAWSHRSHVDGFFHSVGGFARSGRVVDLLARSSLSLGIDVRSGFKAVSIETAANRVIGVRSDRGEFLKCAAVVVAAGAWTPVLIPELADAMVITGHPVFHLRPADENLFKMQRYPTFTADVSQTGWYGFPIHPSEGVVKIANHGVGKTLHPDAERIVTDADENALQTFLSGTFPELLDAPVVYTRRCLYCDTLDSHFWIDAHPEAEGLTVAAGGSGHGFKFAPILGPLIADAVERKSNNWLPRFAWRSFGDNVTGEEPTRYRE